MARLKTGRTTGNLNISLDKTLIEDIKTLAKQEGRTKSNMAAALIKVGLMVGKGRGNHENTTTQN